MYLFCFCIHPFALNPIILQLTFIDYLLRLYFPLYILIYLLLLYILLILFSIRSLFLLPALLFPLIPLIILNFQFIFLIFLFLIIWVEAILLWGLKPTRCLFCFCLTGRLELCWLGLFLFVCTLWRTLLLHLGDFLLLLLFVAN
jgi:hypothetical protein